MWMVSMLAHQMKIAILAPLAAVAMAPIMLGGSGNLQANDSIVRSVSNSSTLECDSTNEACARAAAGSLGTLFLWGSQPEVLGGPNLNEPLVTDRPDFTEASSTVGRGVTQFEFGYTYTKNDEDRFETRSHSYPELLIRRGILADWLELRFAWNYAGQEAGVIENSGAEDLYLGMKIALTPQSKLLPEMALIPQMTVPTGDSDFTADEVLPGLNWVYGWEINDFLSTAGSTHFNRALDEQQGNAYTEWAQSWTVATSLTERIGGYAEWFGLFPHSAETAETEHYFNGGFTYLFSNNIQWDVRGGVGLNDSSDDYFVGTGLSVRFP